MNEAQFRTLRELSSESEISQRDLSKKIGRSLGSMNFILRELIKKGYVKVQRFKNSNNKAAYIYVLTRKGINERVRQTQHFLCLKMEEYEKLRREIDDLQQENVRLDKKKVGTDGRRRAVFLDRDGTIIDDVGYPKYARQVKLIPGVVTALKDFKKKKFLIIIISNQSGIGRGYMTGQQAGNVHRRVLSLLGDFGIELDGAYYCPHTPDEGCDCRKPSPGMLFDASKKFSIDLSRSFMIGDRDVDVETGRNAGCRTLRLRSAQDQSPGLVAADLESDNWEELARYVLDSVPSDET
jgi:EPS-associated MarR family transcriptional regulator